MGLEATNGDSDCGCPDPPCDGPVDTSIPAPTAQEGTEASIVKNADGTFGWLVTAKRTNPEQVASTQTNPTVSQTEARKPDWDSYHDNAARQALKHGDWATYINYKIKYWVGRENLAASERATTAVGQGIGQAIGEMYPAIIVMNTGSYYGLWGDGTDIYGNQQTNFTIFVGAVGVVPVGKLLKAGKALTIVTKSSNNAYDGVRAASKYLQQQGVPRVYRKQILESFEIGTISLRTADNATFGLRFYGGPANQSGRYLFPAFTNHTNRVGLALPPSWNSMFGISQFQVAPKSTYIFGRAASQGGIYIGGSYQMYINDLNNLIK